MTLSPLNNPPLFIFGAPRSGTNALRDSIVKCSDFYTWNCDELNYMWMHQNLGKTDDLNGSDLTISGRQYIHNFFRSFESKVYKKHKTYPHIVEKTCANCLRIPFLKAVFPSFKSIYIHRQASDCVSSALEKSSKAPSLPYLLRKLRYFPPDDFFSYLRQYFKAYNAPKSSVGSASIPNWGPKYPGCYELRSTLSPEEYLYLQWLHCNTAVQRDLLAEPSVLYKCSVVSYEDFVCNPTHVLFNALNELGYEPNLDQIDASVSSIHSRSVGKGKPLSPSTLRLTI